MNGYELTRQWWDFAFSNPDKVKPIHSALYFFAIDRCNRMGWAEKFALPAYMAMGAIGVSHHNTYSKAFDDLVEWGFFHLVQKSKNQHTSNIIALSKIDTALYTALDKATLNHIAEQAQEQGDSTITINKQETTNQKPQTNTRESNFEIPTLEQLIAYVDEKGFMDGIAYEFFEKYSNLGWKKRHGGEPIANWKLTMQTWMKRDYNAKWKKQTTTGRTILPSGTKFFE